MEELPPFLVTVLFMRSKGVCLALLPLCVQLLPCLTSSPLALQLYKPLEFLFLVAATTTLAENFLPQLIAIPKVGADEERRGLHLLLWGVRGHRSQG